MARFSDGPRNSRGYVTPAEAGMTNRPYWQELLEYEGGRVTRRVFNAWWKELPKSKKVHAVENAEAPENRDNPFTPFILELIARVVAKHPELRKD